MNQAGGRQVNRMHSSHHAPKGGGICRDGKKRKETEEQRNEVYSVYTFPPIWPRLIYIGTMPPTHPLFQPSRARDIRCSKVSKAKNRETGT